MQTPICKEMDAIKAQQAAVIDCVQYVAIGLRLIISLDLKIYRPNELVLMVCVHSHLSGSFTLLN